MSVDVTVGIPTRNRYDSLAHTLQSVALQTVAPKEIIIVDDSDAPQDLRVIPIFLHLFRLLDAKGIGWRVMFGARRGQHLSHQLIQKEAKTEWIWRIDDDEIAEPNTLQKLFSFTEPKLGAVGSLVLTPPVSSLPPNAGNSITDLNLPNLQWFSHPSPELYVVDQNGRITHQNSDQYDIDHLHSTYLYRRGVADFESGLSPASFREETLHTYSIKRAGYKVIVTPNSTTWHFKGETRHGNPQDWENDDKLFQERLREWGVNGPPTKLIVLDGGLGDQVVLKSLIPRLKEKYGTLTLAVCNNDIFEGDDVKLISIAEAKVMCGNLDRFNIYRWCIDHQWAKPLQEAFIGMYL